ncbi:hypothetical protein [Deinococcus sp. QL22]|uniref:hypothetical protein n=1 Tax=Deinococcus sp. QL22 TaxID=2939437 RepID=UPI00201781CD|nr:hypothetical protein [Deinococcus sp. QL22]UQN09185.1 hypothetical protein M1R55_24435 [Deinococcus sp. QL22]
MHRLHSEVFNAGAGFAQRIQNGDFIRDRAPLELALTRMFSISQRLLRLLP